MGKRLFLSRENKILAGVCGGVGEYFAVDPTLVRIVFVLACFLSQFLFLFIYILCWAVMPVAPER